MTREEFDAILRQEGIEERYLDGIWGNTPEAVEENFLRMAARALKKALAMIHDVGEEFLNYQNN